MGLLARFNRMIITPGTELGRQAHIYRDTGRGLLRDATAVFWALVPRQEWHGGWGLMRQYVTDENGQPVCDWRRGYLRTRWVVGRFCWGRLASWES